MGAKWVMKILITGANGQLGTELVKMFTGFHQVYGKSRQDVDITDMRQVQKTVQKIMPDLIIHTAGYTNVDQAENNVDTTFLVNAYGTRNVAVSAQKAEAKIVYISTDYVFDGYSSTAYKEFCQTNPQTIYGQSKLAGEEIIKSFTNKYFIVRTSWLYGAHGQNFFKKMYKLAQEKDELFVVDDQIGSPTYTVDLAQFISDLVSTEKYGIYHASNSGHCSWYEFAKAIFEELNIQIKINPISTKDYPSLAKRPYYSVLDNMSIRLNGFKNFRHWREALRDFLKEFKVSFLSSRDGGE